jgi:hypothetical protein
MLLVEEKRCANCIATRAETDQERKEREELMRLREEKRKQFEDDEKTKIASAERYGGFCRAF